MKKSIICLCAGILFPVFLNAQDFSTYEKRKEWILDVLKDATLAERGKHGLPKAIARLEANPHDQAALTYITNILDHRVQSMFDFPGVALALCRYRESFNPSQIKTIQTRLESLAKSDKTGGEGFLGHGTENHATMMWTSAYLFGQLFPDANWVNGMTSKELMADAKEKMQKTFKNVYEKGYTEYLSTTYEVVMNFPVEILLEYAKDPEVKAIAEAFLLYKWSLLSLNNFEGNVLAPYARMNTQQDHQPPDTKKSDSDEIAATTFYNWLMWGWGAATGNVNANHYLNYRESSYSVYTALSRIIPDEIFFKLADSNTPPFTLRSSASTFGTFGTGVPHMMMRKLYRDKTYAIGTGNFRWVPGGDYADHDNKAFNIVWHSPDRFNYIGCYHPYWYSDCDEPGRTPDTWYKGNISPFQQTALHKNTVITLFNIPEKDPWPERPSPSKWAWRDGHADNLIKRGMLRYPKSIDEKIEEKGWIFLREGNTFIGIKPLKSYYEHTDLTGGGMDGFNVIKSDHAQTGFIIELGTEDEFGSFTKFRNRLVKNRISVNWDKLTVSYTNSKKDRVEIQYVPGLPIAKDPVLPSHLERLNIPGLAESVPVVTINGKQEPHYREWPMIESSWINMNKSILDINDGKAIIKVDWRGDYPVIKKAVRVEYNLDN
jgi:hypothetical protein